MTALRRTSEPDSNGSFEDVSGVLDYLHRNLALDADVERKVRVTGAVRRWKSGDGSTELLRAAARQYGWRDDSAR